METYLNNDRFIDDYINELKENERKEEIKHYLSNTLISTLRSFEGQIASDDTLEEIKATLNHWKASSFHDARIDFDVDMDRDTGELKFDIKINPIPFSFIHGID